MPEAESMYENGLKFANFKREMFEQYDLKDWSIL